jgi:hypothetical protein
MSLQLSPADRTEHLFLTVQFIEGIWPEHDTFPVTAVPQTEEVHDFMGAFFGYAVNKVIIIPVPAIILVSQPGGGYNSSAGRLPGKSEHKTADAGYTSSSNICRNTVKFSLTSQLTAQLG